VALPLRRQIIIINAAILLPLIGVVALSSRATYLEQISHIEAESHSIASVMVVYLERGLDLSALQDEIERVPLPEGSVITITDDEGVVLARSRDRARYVGRKVDFGTAPAREVPRSQILPGMDGIERAFANEYFPQGPWLVSVGIPTALARERARPFLERTLLVSIGVLLFGFIFEFLIVRQHAGAFDQAIRGAERVASGDLSPLRAARMPSLEMDRLQAAFIEMVRKLNEAHEALSAQVAEERRMREELERLQRQVIRQERLAAIGVLVAGVAHELNNPLQAILGFADLLQLRNDLPREVRNDLELIQKESTRASAIINNLSRFGRQQTSNPSPVMMRDIVESVVELRQRKLETNDIELVVEDEAEQPVMAVFAEIQQVVLNFLINAEQAVLQSDSVRRIRIRTSDVRDRVRLEIHDTGAGVPRENESKLFQPFFTTKSVGEGTGLGLSVSYGIVQSHGGTIGYSPAVGGGAVFYFELPAAPVAEASSQHVS